MLTDTVNSTLAIDISKAWTTSDVRFIATKKPAANPSLIGQLAWADQKTNSFYIWGGHSPYGSTTTQISRGMQWKFVTDGKGSGSWINATAENQTPQILESFPRSEQGTWITAGDAGFYIGGVASGWTEMRSSVQPISGMISFNMTTKQWRQDSTTGLISEYGTLAGGTAQFAPEFGPNGLVFVLGGGTYALNSSSGPPDGWNEFTTVRFFDPVSRVWYSQNTTGTAPSRRMFPCSVGVQAAKGRYDM